MLSEKKYWVCLHINIGGRDHYIRSRSRMTLNEWNDVKRMKIQSDIHYDLGGEFDFSYSKHTLPMEVLYSSKDDADEFVRTKGANCQKSFDDVVNRWFRYDNELQED